MRSRLCSRTPVFSWWTSATRASWRVRASFPGPSEPREAAALTDMGRDDVEHLEGGFTAWKAAGLPVAQPTEGPHDPATTAGRSPQPPPSA